MNNRKHVVVVGAGFGGLRTVQKLCKQPVEITLIDKTNHHLFQPLLYQVATSALAPGDIAVPARAIFKHNKNVHVRMGEVVNVDKDAKQIHLENGQSFSYDYLILAPGTRHSYFGNDSWEKFAPGLKTLSDALEIRERILMSFEKAEREPDPEKRKRHETFVVVGGGPTGVELAGTIAEISTKTMREDYEHVDLDLLEIILVEGQSRILSTYDESLSQKAARDLEKIGVKVMLNTMVTDVNEDGVRVKIRGDNVRGDNVKGDNIRDDNIRDDNIRGDNIKGDNVKGQSTTGGNLPGDTSRNGHISGTKEVFIESGTVIWGAGNAASPLLETLNVPLEKDGRLRVDADLSLPGHPEVFVIGDAARQVNPGGSETPAIAPGAIQHGDHVARVIRSDMAGKERPVFEYFDKGSMATIGRARAIAQIRDWKFSGVFAWLLWSLVHIFFLIGFRNRFRVMAEWLWFYLTFRGGSRLITRKRMDSEPILQDQE